MKFQSTIVATALALGSLNSADAFASSVAVQSRQKVQPSNSVLGMVATNEIVNGETKPRRTREVSERITLFFSVKAI